MERPLSALSPRHQAPVCIAEPNRISDPDAAPAAAAAPASHSTSVTQKIAGLLSPLLKSSASKRSANDMTKPSVAAAAAVHNEPAAMQQPGNKHAEAAAPAAPMTVYPELDMLIGAARKCALPPARKAPDAWTPNYPSTMLALSSTASPSMARASWCLADYQLVAKLYKGYASNVYKAICRNSNQVVVLKVYTLSAVCDLYKYQIFREIGLHSTMQHEHIITMHAAWHEGDHVVMVQEYADGADLFSVMQRYGGRMSERLAVQLVLEPFLKVLTHLHSRGIMHR